MTSQDDGSTFPPVPGADKYLRLVKALEATRLSQAALAREVNLSDSAISRGVNDYEGLDRHWTDIADALYRHGIRIEWLLYDRGPMKATDTPAQAVPALTPPPVPDFLREVGTVTEQGSYSESLTPSPRAVPGDSAVLVQDGAMDPLIRAGQWVVLSPSHRVAKDGEVVLLRTKAGEAWVRRYRIQDGVVVLEHLNPDRQYRTIVIKKDEVSSTRVVVGVFFE